ncbi:MAG TPA: type IV pilus secretin PilQ [Candidatus Xenobia bacterium]|nr:type IV pilus secretin PilQ [Candidatus Xenobia bacterium]
MMRKPLGGLCAAILLVGLAAQAGLAATETQSTSGAPVRLLAVNAVEQPTGTALQVQASGPFRYASYQPRAQSVVVDLTGVVSERGPALPVASISWLGGYRLLPFRNAGGEDVLRMDLTLKHDCTIDVSQTTADTLTLSCSSAAASAEPAATVSEPAGAPATTPAASAPALASEEPVLVEKVSVRPQQGALRVDIEASGPLAYETRILSDPTRLVIDLPQSVLATRQRAVSVNHTLVTGLRMAQFQAEPPVTRVVVDLKDMLPYQIDATPGGLRLMLGASAGATTLPTAPEKAPTEREPASPEPVMVASLAPTVPASVKPLASSSTPAETAPKTTLVASAPAPASPAPAPPPAQAQAVPTAPPTAQPTRKYSGEPISVNLKDVDLKDFFRLIHEISGLNIIVDPNVSGTVTMVLIDVPWDQALDIVLKNNNLGSTLEGNVLRIATLKTLTQEQEAQRDLAKARAEAVDPVTVPRTLSYAKAADLETVLKRFLSSRGEIIRDERTNTLIIRDIPSVIPDIDNLIKQLDRKSLQVEIEARVVSASRAFSREIGSQLATAFSTTGGRSVYGGALGPSPVEGGAPPPPLVSSGGNSLPLVTNFPAAAATSGILFSHRSPNFALDAILTAAESRNLAKVLSKPRLVTQNNIRAEVKQGTRIPVQTVVNNTISTQFIDVVLKLEVKPQITAEGTVFLDIVIENTQIDPGIQRINGIPALATQQTTTQVLIADGGTVVVGGVMVTNNSTNVEQVPLLGSVPVIGWLFKRTRVDTSTQELLFFITPRILPG